MDNVEIDAYAVNELVVSDINCNFPEAILTHSFEIYNTRVYNSQSRTRPLQTSFQLIGDANVTVRITSLFFVTFYQQIHFNLL